MWILSSVLSTMRRASRSRIASVRLRATQNDSDTGSSGSMRSEKRNVNTNRRIPST